MGKKLICMIVLFMSWGSLVQAQKEPMSWFKNIECTELNIIKHKSISDPTSVADIKIKDKEGIDDIISRIQALPQKGDEMMKPGPKAAHTKLIFTCADKAYQTIEIYNKKFKTPSTGFIAGKNALEDSLYQDIEALLSPSLNHKILKIKGQPIKFKDFTITYTGTDHRPSLKDGPTVGPRNNVFYSIRQEGSANETILSIFDGQIPPGPESFIVEKREYILLTYQNQNKERLYPKYFEITDKFSK